MIIAWNAFAPMWFIVIFLAAVPAIFATAAIVLAVLKLCGVVKTWRSAIFCGAAAFIAGFAEVVLFCR